MGLLFAFALGAPVPAPVPVVHGITIVEEHLECLPCWEDRPTLLRAEVLPFAPAPHPFVDTHSTAQVTIVTP